MRKFLMTTAAVALLGLPAYAFAQESGATAGGSQADSSRGGSTAGPGAAGQTGGGADAGSTAGGSLDSESRGGDNAGPNAVTAPADPATPQALDDPRCVGPTATTDEECVNAEE
ncbi:hypothetical protein [Geminicoccus roseus]|uniref:hypothetical protein n=1 Tax=Geminicoccus roseus TaxID=404900 RepID=UPI0004114977|nr:hypothetical protein [Geminicoccus roseus]